MHPSRSYNTITTLPNGYIRKESSTQRLRDEIEYYRFLLDVSPDLSQLFPRLVKSHLLSKPYYMILEKAPSHDIFLNLGDDEFADRFLDKLEYVLSKFSLYSRQPGNTDNTKNMYYEKTWNEYQNLVKTRPDLLSLFQNDTVVINGTSYLNFETLWIDNIHNAIPLGYTETAIHGDLCFANILFNYDVDDSIRLIDPRGSFGERGIFGDARYDYAKLYHSLDGKYEYLINNWYNLERSNGEYSIFYSSTDEIDDFREKFEERFFSNLTVGKQSKKEIKLIEGCIYIGMCARHADDPTRQLAMYLTGIRILNEALEL